MKTSLIFCVLITIFNSSYANLKYNPISFVLNTDKENYYEGEKVTLNITITNNDKERTLPVLVPYSQNIGQKLFYLTAYDKANNTLLKRYVEDKTLHIMVHDTGTVKIKFLKPQEQIVVPIYLNDFENYYSYHTQNSSHHSFGVPIFAGVYKVNVTYNPKGLVLGDSIYSYYNDFDKQIPNTDKQLMPINGQVTQMIDLKIKRSKDTIVHIEGKKYFIKTDGNRFYYMSVNLDQITTDTSCHHISNLPPDSFSIKNEYFYSHFNYLFGEYVNRFDDGDIREYRKFIDDCPSYLYTEKYNELKQKTLFQFQLPDKSFYSVSYNQPSGSVYQETYCSADGTLCQESTYIYAKNGILIRKQINQVHPCVEEKLEGKTK